MEIGLILLAVALGVFVILFRRPSTQAKPMFVEKPDSLMPPEVTTDSTIVTTDMSSV
jgi:hypothetical protein